MAAYAELSGCAKISLTPDPNSAIPDTFPPAFELPQATTLPSCFNAAKELTFEKTLITPELNKELTSRAPSIPPVLTSAEELPP